MPRLLFEQLLFNESHLSAFQLQQISARRARTGEGFIPAALGEGVIPFETLSILLDKHLSIKTCDLSGLVLPAETAGMLGHFYSVCYNALPVKKESDRLYIAMADPLCGQALAELRDLTGLPIEPMLSRETDIQYCINNLFGSERVHSISARFTDGENARDGPRAPDAEQNARLLGAPAIELIDMLIESASAYRASDIHIEPFENRMRARFRVDGQLATYQEVDASLLPLSVSRLKVMANLNISERRIPQDGRFSMAVRGENIDFRLSTLPTENGEKAVIRLLYGQGTRLKKEELGFYANDLVRLTRLFQSPHGAVFMTGPTGSGKSTTLSGFLAELNTDAVNIVTVEDPVEYVLPGVNHINTDPAAGLTFANALRHILRQDPNIIMIGEIRDAETARIAVQAALTGHLVLSTLHTNDAAGVIERLSDMGIEPYPVSAALNGIISQRLVRRICPNCKQPSPLTGEEAALLQIPAETSAYAGAGCGRCGHTGYAGRFALYEYIIMNEKYRRRMCADPHRFAVWLRRTRAGLKQNALRGIREGHTTAAEVIRILHREIYNNEEIFPHAAETTS
jgi:type IV pilus assembly protein PilB